MRLPVSKAHPAKVVLAVITLHMIATPILLYANVAFWALKKIFQSAGLVIICAFRLTSFV